MLRLSSLAAFAALALALVACGPATIANGGGGSGGSGGGCTYDGTHYDTGATFAASDGCNSCSCDPTGSVACTLLDCLPTCEQAGGTCDAITPEFCADGVVGDASQYSCGSGVGTGCCLPKPTGNTCTDAGGTCDAITPTFCADGTAGDASKYACGTGVGVGCCFHATTCATEPCTTEGATRCSGSVMQVCGYNPATNCALEWLTQAACPDGQSCNSDATKCVAPVTSCTAPADCGCGCTCTSAGVCGECTGAIPPTCTVDADCGPACYGYQCVSGKCQQHTP